MAAASLVPGIDGVTLHIFLDVSSVDVFAANEEVVMTKRIFPDAASKSISLYSKGGKTKAGVWLPSGLVTSEPHGPSMNKPSLLARAF